MICPNCCIEMVEKTKRFGPLGGKRIFIQCPKCGYNIKKASLMFYQQREYDDFQRMKEIINNNELIDNDDL